MSPKQPTWALRPAASLVLALSEVGRRLRAVEQGCRRNLKGAGDSVDVVEADVPLATFYLPHVGAIESSRVSELFLAHPAPSAEVAHSLPKRATLCELLSGRGRHSSTVGVWCL